MQRDFKQYQFIAQMTSVSPENELCFAWFNINTLASSKAYEHIIVWFYVMLYEISFRSSIPKWSIKLYI